MRKIEIDDQVWRSLQSHAKPFEDTPNSVLRRLFRSGGPDHGSRSHRSLENTTHAPASTGWRGSRARRGIKTSQRAYRKPILQTLLEFGGQARTGAVLDRVGELMKEDLNATDMNLLGPDG